MIKRGGLETGCGVTDRAVLREPGRNMVGILGTIVIRLVAGEALGGSTRKNIVDVTLTAFDVDVSAGQRERALAVVENGSEETGSGVTGRAIGRKAGRRVVGIRGGVVVRLMASDACRRRPRKPVVCMALVAGKRRMHSSQRKAGRTVIECGSREARG